MDLEETMIHSAAPIVVTIVVHKPLTSLKELCTHIQETFSKQRLRIPDSTDTTMSISTCAVHHIPEWKWSAVNSKCKVCKHTWLIAYEMHSTYTGFNPCAHNNGGCAHLCLLSFNDQRSYTCACHSGTRLHENGHDCIGKIVLIGKV